MTSEVTVDLLERLRSTAAYVNLANLENNIALARKMSQTDIIAVVKADAYGHGAVRIAGHAFEKCGVKNFGVATVSEGLLLRSSFKSLEPAIIIFGYVDSIFFKDVVDAGLILTVYDYDYATQFHEYLVKNDLFYPVILKLDTGMNRLGFKPDLRLDAFYNEFPRLKVLHVMSHLSSSDSDDDYTRWQIGQFDDFIQKNSHYSYTTSLFNSSAIAQYNNKYSLTRPGLFLYGYSGSDVISGLKTVMQIRSKVIHIKRLFKGESTGYNKTFTADKDMTVGIVPVGYADGYRLSLSNKGFMAIDGKRCRVLGRVCMDMAVIDLSGTGENVYGKNVEILGEDITLKELAVAAGTIEYEILTGISARIPRIYSY